MGVFKEWLQQGAGKGSGPNNSDMVEKMGFKTKLYQVVTEIYRVAKREGVEFKKLGIEMMCQLIELMQDCHEEGEEESSDEDDRAKKKKKQVGPLLLEEYEAQIQSVIVSSLQDIP